MNNLCDSYMSSIAVTCFEQEPLAHAAQLMRDQHVTFLAITDVTRRVTGILTERDLVTRALAARVPADTPIRAIMSSRPVVAVMPEDSIETARRKMLQTGTSRVLVTGRHGIVLGVIHRGDIARIDRQRRTGLTPEPLRADRHQIGAAS